MLLTFCEYTYLACYKEIFPFDFVLFYFVFNSFADLTFVLIQISAVYVSISTIYRLFDSSSDFTRGRLKSAKVLLTQIIIPVPILWDAKSTGKQPFLKHFTKAQPKCCPAFYWSQANSTNCSNGTLFNNSEKPTIPA